MAKAILSLSKWKSKFKSHYYHLLYLIVCAITLVLIAYCFDVRVLGSGKNLMTTTLFASQKFSSWWTAIFRIAGPIFCFTTGASGGVFAPSLSAGAGIGSVLSGWFNLVPQDANVLILAGMAAFLTGVTRTPFTSGMKKIQVNIDFKVIANNQLLDRII
ncbi:MAG: hypothetical protein E6H06_02025 [Bacteroidetes bacterium]|nr:MAG: hypothetical protein E6H06_02025 [Bacteroidota bacterium]